MEAGGELDAKIAKLMGFTYGYADDPELTEKCWIAPNGGPWNISELPYSTCIKKAWEVVLEFQRRGKSFELAWDAHELDKTFSMSNHDIDNIFHRGWSYENGDDLISESADTAPHSICLAALKTVVSNE